MSLLSKRLMPPPYIAYKNIERYSIGWRMGSGESYMASFCSWFYSLSNEEQLEYRELFKEPILWTGFFDESDNENFLSHNNYYIETFSKDGKPKYSKESLLQEKEHGYLRDFYFFWGHQGSITKTRTKSCLSQWWMEKFHVQDTEYICMEQYMMAQKAELFSDTKIQQQILECNDAKKIKDLGRQVHNFDIDIWNKFKYSIVLNGNFHKFYQNKELCSFLLQTKNAILVEASPYDNIWGIALSEHMIDARDIEKWKGENLLGFALMEVRDEIAKITKNEHYLDFSFID